MEYRRLGRTDIEVSTVCLGGWSIVSEDFNWGRQDVKDSIEAVRASLDAGVNFFDTAEAYGGGESEEILAEALRGVRHRVVIASKVTADHLEADKLRASCEQSLRRLRTDYIDLYQIHWPSRTIPFATILETLESLRRAGKVRAIGVSNFGPKYLTDAVAAGGVETNQLPYSLLWRPIEAEIQPLCVEHKIGILCYSPLCQGLLTGKFASADEVPPQRARTRLFSHRRPHCRHHDAGCEEQAFRAIEAIREICRSIGQPMGRVALAWLLARPGVTAGIAGARSAAQAAENARAGDLKLTDDVVRRLEAATDEVKAALGTNADPWQMESRMEPQAP